MFKILRHISCFIIVSNFYLAAVFAQFPSSQKIQCLPAARWGLFREADTISIQTTNNLPIQITDLDGTVVYQGAPTSLVLPRGHYFVTCSDDAAEFAVLPNDYAGSPFLGMEAITPGQQHKRSERHRSDVAADGRRHGSLLE